MKFLSWLLILYKNKTMNNGEHGEHSDHVEKRQTGSINEKGFCVDLDKRGFTKYNCLSELISNSIDAINRLYANDNLYKGKIVVRLVDNTLFIHDNGVGMASNDIDTIVSLFGENHKNDHSHGISGLGLKVSTKCLSDNGVVKIYSISTQHEKNVVEYPWNTISTEFKYTGNVTTYKMSEDIRNRFVHMHTRAGITEHHGTIIEIPIKEKDEISNMLYKFFGEYSYNKKNFSNLFNSTNKNPDYNKVQNLASIIYSACYHISIQFKNENKKDEIENTSQSSSSKLIKTIDFSESESVNKAPIKNTYELEKFNLFNAPNSDFYTGCDVGKILIFKNKNNTNVNENSKYVCLGEGEIFTGQPNPDDGTQCILFKTTGRGVAKQASYYTYYTESPIISICEENNCTYVGEAIFTIGLRKNKAYFDEDDPTKYKNIRENKDETYINKNLDNTEYLSYNNFTTKFSSLPEWIGQPLLQRNDQMITHIKLFSDAEIKKGRSSPEKYMKYRYIQSKIEYRARSNQTNESDIFFRIESNKNQHGQKLDGGIERLINEAYNNKHKQIESHIKNLVDVNPIPSPPDYVIQPWRHINYYGIKGCQKDGIKSKNGKITIKIGYTNKNPKQSNKKDFVITFWNEVSSDRLDLIKEKLSREAQEGDYIETLSNNEYNIKCDYKKQVFKTIENIINES